MKQLKHIVQGRRFEISMLCFTIETCDCCGRTMPFHNDPFLDHSGDAAKFRHKHLASKFYEAYHCTCDDVCKGAQFYCADCPNHRDAYETVHSVAIQTAFEDGPNAKLCEFCYFEYQGKPDKGTSPITWFCLHLLCFDQPTTHFLFHTFLLLLQ